MQSLVNKKKFNATTVKKEKSMIKLKYDNNSSQTSFPDLFNEIPNTEGSPDLLDEINIPTFVHSLNSISERTELTNESTISTNIANLDHLDYESNLDKEDFSQVSKGSKGEVKEVKRASSKLVNEQIEKYLEEGFKQGCDICNGFAVVGGEFMHDHAQEPWPKDVRLFQPYEAEQILLPDNANCLAVQTFLKMCNLDYTVDYRPNAEAMSPTGKVPFIKCGAFIIAELEEIVRFVGTKGISLSESLTTENKSDMRAYMALINNVFGNAELYVCWCDDETYTEVTKPRYGSVYPWPLNHIQTWTKRADVLKRLRILGWYDKKLEDVYNDVEQCCQALTDRLDGSNSYFFGTKPTELEALLFGHLYTILTTPLPNANLANIVKNFPKLIDLITGIEKTYFKKETQH